MNTLIKHTAHRFDYLKLEGDICDLYRQILIVACLRRGEVQGDIECDDGSLSMLAIDQLEDMGEGLRKKFYELHERSAAA